MIALAERAGTERVRLDATSWVDVTRGWLDGADELYDALAAGVAWRQGRLWRYERWVEEPRLNGGWRPGAPAPHPSLPELHRQARNATGKAFPSVAFAWYRDGRDGVAFHRDREMRWLDDTVIGVLTLGARRPFLLRPRARRHGFAEDHDPAGSGVIDLAPAAGDLLVMGGRCQADWEHAVPRTATPVRGRISLQWRWTSRRGRPESGGNFRDPRFFSR